MTCTGGRSCGLTKGVLVLIEGEGFIGQRSYQEARREANKGRDLAIKGMAVIKSQSLTRHFRVTARIILVLPKGSEDEETIREEGI